MRFQPLTITCIIWIALSYESMCIAEEDGKTDNGSYIDVPQDFVMCTGWHALCTDSLDCSMHDDKADCNCMRVNETHFVLTSEIQDTEVKNLTQAKCTREHPCDIDQAPVCAAIKTGQYEVNGTRYDWVSTYSYRGWCSLLKRNFTPCDQTTTGYSGDKYWAICDCAPCTENQNASNPDKPLICECRVKNETFVGMNGSCTGENGGIMSSMSPFLWDFQNNTYPFPMPGYEYVQGACADLKSDPLPSQPSRTPQSTSIFYPGGRDLLA